MKFILSLISLCCATILAAQTCTAPGQNPSTAFPVCGTSVFTQNSVPICGGKRVPSPTCTATLRDVNPFWYKFTCFQSGTLAFKISPHTNSEDYDWSLFDVTNRNPDDLYSDVNMVVGSNWSGEGGETGASSAGNQLNICDGYGRPLWSKMPTLVQGHEYLLLVSHFTQTQAGYDLSFGGGTAVITDSTAPRMKSADASCGGDVVRVKLNKKMKCSSITANGSDFFISPGNISVANALAIGCSTGFDADSVELHLASFLAPGNYSLHVKQGTDGNTVLDYCDNPIPLTDQVSFTVFPLQPTPMDSMEAIRCSPSTLRLIFRKPMLCSTVAADGSDFLITGPAAITVAGARGNCSGSLTSSKEILITLAQPIQTAGNFTLSLKVGSDGNTILDECGQQTPPGSSLSFITVDTVNADFSYQKLYGCATDTVQFTQAGKGGITSWQWNLDEGQTSTLQNPEVFYHVFSQKKIQLIVNNSLCRDTSVQTILLGNYLQADFTSYDDNCPNEPVQFTGNATGIGIQYSWSFGDGGSAQQTSPTHIYGGPSRTTSFIVRCTVTDSIGCVNTVQKTIKIYASCLLAVPSAFTPNNDGLNDFLYPLNAVKADNLVFRVFNRWGMLVFQTNNWKNGWDGTFKGSPQESGVYVWFLSFTDRDTKEHRQMKGTAALIR